ncbi:hypothetical protein NKG05_15425 [Oerskovia sp. M15]
MGVVVVGEKPYAEGVGDVRYAAGSAFSLSLTAQDQATIDTVCGAMDCVVLVVSGGRSWSPTSSLTSTRWSPPGCQVRRARGRGRAVRHRALHRAVARDVAADRRQGPGQRR